MTYRALFKLVDQHSRASEAQSAKVPPLGVPQRPELLNKRASSLDENEDHNGFAFRRI